MECLSFLFHLRWCLTRVGSWCNIAMTIQWSPSSRPPSRLQTPRRGGPFRLVISLRYGASSLSCHNTYTYSTCSRLSVLRDINQRLKPCVHEIYICKYTHFAKKPIDSVANDCLHINILNNSPEDVYHMFNICTNFSNISKNIIFLHIWWFSHVQIFVKQAKIWVLEIFTVLIFAVGESGTHTLASSTAKS